MWTNTWCPLNISISRQLICVTTIGGQVPLYYSLAALLAVPGFTFMPSMQVHHSNTPQIIPTQSKNFQPFWTSLGKVRF
ncbi:hypothetical protein OE88DRAFT_446941 [Heliocybe sulcata]|uniref:Uncharacterized protein n=1 Tax=Heliocybe sulcata TaxID=5364 RepID=A0A5C3MVT1_9AGAM|nr:hypothetical protein OE88DRAFT_446941 [Heliocybe sulcata]